MDWMERKPVSINGRQVFVFPWATAWDVLLAAPGNDFQDVWTGKAILEDEASNRVFPEDVPRAGQQIYVIRKRDGEFSAE